MPDRTTEIRARLEAAAYDTEYFPPGTRWQSTKWQDMMTHAPADLQWLLDEHERLTQERDALAATVITRSQVIDAMKSNIDVTKRVAKERDALAAILSRFRDYLSDQVDGESFADGTVQGNWANSALQELDGPFINPASILSDRDARIRRETLEKVYSLLNGFYGLFSIAGDLRNHFAQEPKL